MQLYFSDPTGKIWAVAFEGRNALIKAYDQNLQFNRIYTIRNALVKPWVMGPFVHLCEIVLPEVSEVFLENLNVLRTKNDCYCFPDNRLKWSQPTASLLRKKKEKVSWPDEEVESFNHQDKKVKFQLSEDKPSTASIKERLIKRSFKFILRINRIHRFINRKVG